MQALQTELKVPVILVLVNGLAVSIPWAAANVPAVIEALRGGQSAGTALASALWGDFSPLGRLPYSIVKGVAQLPDFGDMDLLKGRTYRYYNATKFGAPLVYQFGDGLAYSTFKYSGIKISRAEVPKGTKVQQGACYPVTVNVTLTNTGKVPAKEVAQLYVSIGNGAAVNLPPAAATAAAAPPGPSPCWPNCAGSQANPFAVVRPNAEMRGATVTPELAPGASVQLSWTLTARDISVVYRDGERYVEPGVVGVHVGGSAPHGLASGGMVSSRFATPGFAPLQLKGLCPLSARQFWHPTRAELGL